MFITQSKRAVVFCVVASDTFDSLCVRDFTAKKYKLKIHHSQGDQLMPQLIV